MSEKRYDGFEYSLEYFYDELEKNSIASEGKAATLRAALVTHLKEMVEVIHIIDYVDSGDLAEGSEIEPIENLLGKHTEILQLKKEAEEVLNKLQLALKN
jgi:hypothetical protein